MRQSLSDNNNNNNNNNDHNASVAAAVFVLSLALRSFRLALPPAIVFDEAFFGAFVDHVLERTAYFDIHPPLPKLTLALCAWFLGYRVHPRFVYDSVGRDYHAVQFLALRLVSVLFGAMANVLVFLTAKSLPLSTLCAVFCALLFMFDPLNVVESRLVLLEAQLLFYLALSLYCALSLWRAHSKSPTASFFWLTCTAFACSCAVSVKWTALVTPALIAIVSFFALHFIHTPLSLLQCIWMLFVAALCYVFFFYVHFKRITHTAPAALFYMPRFRSTLIGDPAYDPSATPPSFLRMVWHINRAMFDANAAALHPHHWQTYWYQWILNWRGLLMFTRQSDDSRWQIVYLLCNPVVCVSCAFFVLAFALIRMLCIRYPILLYRPHLVSSVHKQHFFGTGTFLFFGWLLNLLPYLLVDRSAFVYHYLPALMYAQLLSALVVDQLPVRLKGFVVFTLSLAVIVTYVYFAPWVYCLPLDAQQHAKRRWWGRWD
ncbi:unnamed protein product [Agarophyton chilense]